MTSEQIAVEIAKLTSGKAFQMRGDAVFALVRPVEGGYQVECGVRVDEGYSDDYMSHTYHPFKNNKMQPWVGRQILCATAHEAAGTYADWRDKVNGHSLPDSGRKIGSVIR